MNRRSVVRCCSIAVGALLLIATGGASTAPLITSTITVNVLSVDRGASSQWKGLNPNVPVTFEKTDFVARALVTDILKGGRGLSLNPGDVIEIRYSVTVRQPPVPNYRVGQSLSPGETVTVTVSGTGTPFSWRN